MMNINLAKISVKETAKAKMTVNFDGTSQECEYRALTDGELVTMQSIIRNTDNVFRTRDLYVFLLCCGFGLEQPIAQFLYDNVTAEAIRCGDAVGKLSELFGEVKEKEAETAEKN